MGYDPALGSIVMVNHWMLNANLRAGIPLREQQLQLSPRSAVSQHAPILGADNICICGEHFHSYRELRQHGLASLTQALPGPRAAEIGPGVAA